jgi:hypothetical protein
MGLDRLNRFRGIHQFRFRFRSEYRFEDRSIFLQA